MLNKITSKAGACQMLLAATYIQSRYLKQAIIFSSLFTQRVFMRIQTITSLSLTEHWNGVNAHSVAKKQGNLDGACGPYALMNALMLAGRLTEKQVTGLWASPVDRRTLFGKWSQRTHALVSDGTEIKDLVELLQGIRQKLKQLPALDLVPIKLESRQDGKMLGGLRAIQEWMDVNHQPVMANLQWNRHGAHWVVVIGSQFHERDGEYKLANLLVVDSEENAFRTQAWNGVLGLGSVDAKRLRYTVASHEESIPCDLVGAFGICKIA